jgi:DNA-binding protein H-NS
MSEEDGAYAPTETPVTYLVLKDELEEVTARAKELEKELARVRNEARNSLVANILTSIADHGFDKAEILDLLEKKSGGKAKAAKASKPAQQLHDPEVPGQTYSKGALPAWIKERMRSLDLDPGDALHRKHYRDNYLQPVE